MLKDLLGVALSPSTMRRVTMDLGKAARKVEELAVTVLEGEPGEARAGTHPARNPNWQLMLSSTHGEPAHPHDGDTSPAAIPRGCDWQRLNARLPTCGWPLHSGLRSSCKLLRMHHNAD